MPVIIIEGCDKTGKTSLATMLHGMTLCRVVKVSQPTTHDPLGEYEEIVRQLDDPAITGLTVLDRFHLGEFVYGPIFRAATPNPFRAGRLEAHLATLPTAMVMMSDKPDAIISRFTAHDETFAETTQVREILRRYEEVYDWCTLPKMRGWWSTDPAENARFANEVVRFSGVGGMTPTTEHDTMDLCYLDLLLRVTSAEADIVSPRGRQTRELRPALFTLRNPRRSVITSKARNLNQAFAAAEFCWIMAGDHKLHPLVEFNSHMADFADCGSAADRYFYGAYGPHVVTQLPHVLAALTADESSRQAVISIWRPNPPRTKDVPCTLTLQFLIRHGYLEAITSMRSNDLMLGTPYDVQTFTRLQLYVASKLGVPVGPYHHLVGSLHLYSDDLPKAEAIIAELPKTAGAPLPDFDPTVPPHALWAAVRKGAIPASWDAVAGWGPLAVTMRDYLERKAARAARATA